MYEVEGELGKRNLKECVYVCGPSSKLIKRQIIERVRPTKHNINAGFFTYEAPTYFDFDLILVALFQTITPYSFVRTISLTCSHHYSISLLLDIKCNYFNLLIVFAF